MSSVFFHSMPQARLCRSTSEKATGRGRCCRQDGTPQCRMPVLYSAVALLFYCGQHLALL
jgi:hypothetical protein